MTLICESKLSLLEKVEIMELLIAKGAYVNETALAQGVETFVLEVGHGPRPNAQSDN